MDSSLNEKNEGGVDNVQDVPQLEMVVCPGCRQTVPKKVFCPSCGYPQYLEGVGRTGADAKGDFDLGEISGLANVEKQGEVVADVMSEEDVKSEPADSVADLLPEAGADGVSPAESAKPNGLFSSVRRFMGLEKGSNHRNGERTGPHVLMVSGGGSGVEGLKEVEASVEEMASENGGPEVTEGVRGAVELDSVEPLEVTRVPQEPVVVEPPSDRGVVSAPLFEPDPESIDVQRGLLQGVSMELWLVNLLQEGGVEGPQFEKMFGDYEAQLSDCMDQREKMLSRSQDTGSVERALREARVYLEELKMRRSIGRASEEEYGVKARAIEWDINNFEGVIFRKRSEVEFFEDPTRVVPVDEVNRLKEMAERCKWAMDSSPERLSSETSSRVRDSLQRTIDFLSTLRLPGS